MRLHSVPGGWSAWVLTCAILAGCGSAAPGLDGQAVTPSGAGHPVTGPASRSGRPGSTGPGRSHTGSAPGTGCPARTRPPAGGPVAGRQLGAIDFLSGRVGLALTATQVPCSGPGQEISVQPQPVRLAVSSDGGRHWVSRGASLPSTPQSAVPEVLFAASAQDVWALSDTGPVRSTQNAGATWTVQPLPQPVVALAGRPGPAGTVLWALSCPASGQGACTPVLNRRLLPGGRWQREPLPPLAVAAYPRLAVLSAATVVVLASRASDARPLLVLSTDAGRPWASRAAPAGPGHLCTADTSMTAAGPRDWWLLCTGGAAAGSSTMALLRTGDAGRTWTTAAAITSLAQAPRPGGLPGGDAVTLAAGSATRLWLALVNGAATSADGGRSWTAIAGISPQGALGSFDVQSATSAWLLTPGTGLWHTADGRRWQPLGPVSG